MNGPKNRPAMRTHPKSVMVKDNESEFRQPPPRTGRGELARPDPRSSCTNIKGLIELTKLISEINHLTKLISDINYLPILSLK